VEESQLSQIEGLAGILLNVAKGLPEKKVKKNLKVKKIVKIQKGKNKMRGNSTK
jgi:hypothetical protein